MSSSDCLFTSNSPAISFLIDSSLQHDSQSASSQLTNLQNSTSFLDSVQLQQQQEEKETHQEQKEQPSVHNQSVLAPSLTNNNNNNNNVSTTTTTTTNSIQPLRCDDFSLASPQTWFSN